MTVATEREVFAHYVQRFLGERAGIMPALREAAVDSAIVDETITGLDRAVTSLNEFIAAPYTVVHSQSVLLPNATRVKGNFTGQELPTLTQLAQDRSVGNRALARRSFQAAERLMFQGEEGRENGWELHQTILDPAHWQML